MTKAGFADLHRADHWGVSASGKVVCVDYGVGPDF